MSACERFWELYDIGPRAFAWSKRCRRGRAGDGSMESGEGVMVSNEISSRQKEAGILTHMLPVLETSFMY